jgi:large subunit ribosomal protein L21e
MVKHKHKGKRSKSRHTFKKSVRQRGDANVNVMLQKFDIGERVHITVNPGVHKAMPYRRFIGKTGVVTKKQGNCYLVHIKDMDKEKDVLVHPAHLTGEKK